MLVNLPTAGRKSLWKIEQFMGALLLCSKRGSIYGNEGPKMWQKVALLEHNFLPRLALFVNYRKSVCYKFVSVEVKLWVNNEHCHTVPALNVWFYSLPFVTANRLSNSTVTLQISSAVLRLTRSEME